MSTYRCVVHGSFGQHIEQIKSTIACFQEHNIQVLAPSSTEITALNKDFLLLEGEENLDPRYVELSYLHNLQKLGSHGFSYFVNPDGYIGKSAAYELGIAHALNVPCYFSHKPQDLPAYYPSAHIISPQKLSTDIQEYNQLPYVSKRVKTQKLHKMFMALVRPNAVVAAGAIIVHQAKETHLPEVLLVKTHKWLNKYSIVGGKVRQGERLNDALQREVYEETGLRADIDNHIITFDQLEKSGYYQEHIQHLFVDYSVRVSSKRVRLNEEAQSYVWMPAEQALAELDIEPNARYTLERYLAMQT